MALIFTDSMSSLMRRPVSRCQPLSVSGRHVTRRVADGSGAQQQQQQQRKRGSSARASSTNVHNDRGEARAGGGISGGARPRPPAALPLPGAQQLRPGPSRRKQEHGAGAAESCVRNHKLERGREGERTGRGGGVEEIYIYFLRKKKSSKFTQHEWAFG